MVKGTCRLTTTNPLGHNTEAADQDAQSFLERGLFASPTSCSPRGRLLIERIRRDGLQRSPETLEDSRCYFCALPWTHSSMPVPPRKELRHRSGNLARGRYCPGDTPSPSGSASFLGATGL